MFKNLVLGFLLFRVYLTHVHDEERLVLNPSESSKCSSQKYGVKYPILLVGPIFEKKRVSRQNEYVKTSLDYPIQYKRTRPEIIFDKSKLFLHNNNKR